MSFVYSHEEEELLKTHMPEIEKRVRLEELKLPPSAQERDKIKKTILQFVKKRNRIVYGGYALDCLISDASERKERVYSDHDYPDIEFYTPHLKADVRDLTDLFYVNGHKHVFAEEGVHPATFVIKVEFVGVCDITFTPAPFFESIPSVKVDGIRLVSPEFAMIDVFRVYNYPLNNYFRLTKSFTRANLLLKYYPLDFGNPPRVEKAMKHERFVLDAFSDTMIVTGQVAQNRFCQEAGIEQDPIIPPILAVSTSYEADVKRLKHTFRGKETSYLPFTELLGRKTLFYHNHEPVLLLIEEEDTCVPYHETTPRISTLHGTVFYALCMLYQARMQKRDTAKELRILSRIQAAKKAFYAKNPTMDITSPGFFEEFVVRCKGKAVSAFRKFGIERAARIMRRKMKCKNEPIKYRYTPAEKQSRDNMAFMAMQTYMTVGQQEKPSSSLDKGKH